MKTKGNYVVIEESDLLAFKEHEINHYQDELSNQCLSESIDHNSNTFNFNYLTQDHI